MLPLSGIIGRIANAVLVGVIVFLVVFVLAVILKSFSPEIAAKLQEFAPILGLLAGLVSFFLSPPRNVV